MSQWIATKSTTLPGIYAKIALTHGTVFGQNRGLWDVAKMAQKSRPELLIPVMFPESALSLLPDAHSERL